MSAGGTKSANPLVAWSAPLAHLVSPPVSSPWTPGRLCAQERAGGPGNRAAEAPQLGRSQTSGLAAQGLCSPFAALEHREGRELGARAWAPPFLGQRPECQLCPLASGSSTAWEAPAFPPVKRARACLPTCLSAPVALVVPQALFLYELLSRTHRRPEELLRWESGAPRGRGHVSQGARWVCSSRPLRSAPPSFPGPLPVLLPGPRFVFQRWAAGQRRDVRPHRRHERRVLPGPLPAFRGRPGAAFTASGTVRALSRPGRRPAPPVGAEEARVGLRPTRGTTGAESGGSPQPAPPQTCTLMYSWKVHHFPCS